jgi:hypothetical protein
VANPLDDLWQKLIGYVHPTVSQGPAVTTNTSLPTAGKWTPESPLHSLASSVLPGLIHPGGLITVNPNNTASVERTIQHEKVHALLGKLDDDGTLDKLNASNPYYQHVASKILLEPGTSASTEAPAYTATGESSQFGIDPKIAKQYNQHLQGQLKSIDPDLAKAYGALSQ